MDILFDSNGNATETHIVKVSGFEKGTGEHTETYDVRILSGTGIPGYSTMTIAPSPNDGYAVCWNGIDWQQVTDLRGKTVYQKSNGEPFTVKALGELDDAYTFMKPATEYDKWDGVAWVTDTAAAIAANIVAAEQQKQQLITAAQQSISLLQTKLLMGRTLTDAEKNTVNVTLDYIDEVEATDTSTIPVNFPHFPLLEV